MSNVLHSSNTNEWYTPPEIIRFCKDILGEEIELDPASCAKAQEIVGAKRYYTKEDDGLSMPWGARTVFCNPPYGRQVGKWVDKMHEAYYSSSVEEEFYQGLMLVNATPDRRWFQRGLESCDRVFFFTRRIKFLDSKTMMPRTSPTHGNALFIWSGCSNKWILSVAEEHGIEGSLVELVE